MRLIAGIRGAIAAGVGALALAGCSVLPMEWFESSAPETPGYGTGLGIYLFAVKPPFASTSTEYWSLWDTNSRRATNAVKVSVAPYLSWLYGETNVTGYPLDGCVLGIEQANNLWDQARYSDCNVAISWPDGNTPLTNGKVSSFSNLVHSGVKYFGGDSVTVKRGAVYIAFPGLKPRISPGSNIRVVVSDPVSGEVFHGIW